MEKREKLKFISSLVYPVIFVILIWSIELIEQSTDMEFTKWGIYPKSAEGLIGIITGPLIHSDWKHLLNNSLPMLILGSSLFYFYREVAWKVFWGVYLMGGFWTWVAARESYHIGASGVIYGLFGFLLLSGFLRRHKQLMAISFLVAFIYGSMVWGIFPMDYKVSWEGHLFGLMAGLALAVFYRKKGPQRPVYEWDDEEEEDENEGNGDENGNDDYWNTGLENNQDKSSGDYKGIEYIYIPKSKKNENQ